MLTDMTNVEIPRFAIDEEAQAHLFFVEFGFVIYKDFFNQEIIDFKLELKQIINSYLLKLNFNAIYSDFVYSEGIQLIESYDHEYVAAIYDTIISCPSFFRICGNSVTEHVIKALLDCKEDSSLYGFTNRCRIDPPMDDRRTYGWHQEVFYTIPKSSFIQTWAPLIFDSTSSNGTIEILPKSHQESVAEQSWNEIPGRATQILINDDISMKYQPTIVAMKLGEMMFFSGKLAHRSGTNSSSQVRYSLVGMYHDILSKSFIAPKIAIEYRQQTPHEYFNEVFPDN
jgi:hypothetical protein